MTKLPSEPNEGPLLTIRQSATQMNMSERQVWRLIKRQQLRVIRIGRAVRVSPADLRQFLDRARDSSHAGSSSDNNPP
jgi:excisionase family DNA binding protein